MARANMGWKSSIVAACLICASAFIVVKAGHPVAAANDTLMQSDRALTAARAIATGRFLGQPVDFCSNHTSGERGKL
jgi:hypothetical protein